MSRPSALPYSTRDAADRQDEIDLALREIVGHLVSRDAVFVQPARLRAHFEHGHVMPMHAPARCAHDNPAGPAPTTATRFPVGSARVKGWISRSNSQSVA